ncbi:MAG: hypothetical protein WD063_11920 [Pirellulales bacterium]
MSQVPTQREHLSRAPRPVVTFDDRLWPVIAALVVLAGMGAAIIAALANFHDPRPWANGWTWLASLAALTLLLIWGVSRLDPARRGLQLAAVLSVIFHILLFVSLNRQRLIPLAEARSMVRPPSEPIEPYRAPDYHIRGPEDPLEEHEKPVTASLPEEQPAELERREKQRLEEQPPPSQPTPLEPEEPEVQPHAVPLREPQEAAPRLAEFSSELSRTEPSPVEPAEPEPVPTPQQELAAEPLSPEPAEQASARREVARETPELAPSPEPAAESRPSSAVDVANLSRHTVAEQTGPANRPSLPGLSGRSQQAPQLSAPRIADVPRAQSGVDEPLDEPQPLVKVPLRSGTGNRLPIDLGTIRDTSRQSVTLGQPETRVARAEQNVTPSLAEPGGTGSFSPTRAAGKLDKSSATATPLPSLGTARASEAVAASGTSRTASATAPQPARRASQPSRSRTAASLPVRIAAPEGIGGVAAEVTPQVGTPSRRARQESLVVPATARLLARMSGGPPAIDGRTREPAEAFARRGGRSQIRGRAPGGPSEQTEAVIELGLVFLARHQAPDGGWSLHFAPQGDDNPDDPPTFRAETAATALALLSFLGAGYDHYGGRYADVVERALDNLIAHQQQNGDLYRSEDDQSNESAALYSHGIAAIALCEAYGMTGDAALANPAQKAIDFIVAAQDPVRGGWRYIPGNGSDTSVGGWQLMALKSGELARLDVPRAAYEKVQRWLDRAQVQGSQYAYNPAAPGTPEQGHGRLPTPAMTAVGLLMRLYTGLNRDDAHLVEGAEYLLGRLPQNGTSAQPARDTYYWYYATQVMFHMRGKYWRAWNDRLHPLLVNEQIPNGPLAGSWDPRRPVPDRWGPHAGRIYVTTLNLLSLEVYYRHLPLYESTAR